MAVALKKKMLFVDDRSKRIHSALRQFSDKYDVTIAPNFQEAMRLLSSRDWDVVSLDHDLNGNDFEDPDSPTCGMAIVRYIEKTGWPKNRKLPDFVIHTSNAFAAHLMSTRLSIALASIPWRGNGSEPEHRNAVVYQWPFVYDIEEEHMKYDGEGLPIL